MSAFGKHIMPNLIFDSMAGAYLGGAPDVSYPMVRMTHPSRNFFVLSLFCVFMYVCKSKSAGL